MLKTTRAAFAALVVACAAPAAAILAPSVAFAQMNSEDVSVVVNGAAKAMQYSAPQIKTRARAMGYGGVGQYAALPGPAAAVRVTSASQPTFLVALPSAAQPNSLVVVAKLEPRKNNTREVIIGGGYMNYSTGIHQDRQIPVTIAPRASQAGAPAGNTIYTITPVAPLLPPGEYAIIVSSAMAGAQGIGGRFYDFGVD